MTRREAIAADVRRRLLAGEWTPGQQMPGVAELCEQYDVSTATAVHAMRDLADKRLLERRHGTGYYAAAPPSTVDVEDLRAATRRARTALDDLDTLITRWATQHSD